MAYEFYRIFILVLAITKDGIAGKTTIAFIVSSPPSFFKYGQTKGDIGRVDWSRNKMSFSVELL